MRAVTGILVIAITSVILSACQHKPYVLPVSERHSDPAACFQRDVLPIFISNCAKGGCHDAQSHEEGYILDSYEHIMKKGIVPGNYAASKIYESMIGNTEERMPQDAPPLSSQQLNIIKEWIAAGAVNDSCGAACDSNNITFTAGIQPLMNLYCTGCHSGSNPSGSLVLTNYASVKAAVQNRNLVHSIRYDAGYIGMPQTGLRLSACEVRQVEKWVDAGMQNN